MDCIDLKARFGKIHRVRTSPDYHAETGSTINQNRDSWNWILIGSRGHICPWGGDNLAVCIDGHPLLCKRLSKEPWVIDCQYGDDGINAVFHICHSEKAAKYAQLYKKRKLTPAQREALISAGVHTRRKKANRPSKSK